MKSQGASENIRVDAMGNSRMMDAPPWENARIVSFYITRRTMRTLDKIMIVTIILGWFAFALMLARLWFYGN